jgi:acetyl-CoA acyltransferase
MREVYIVALGRSAIGKAPRGKLKNSRPEDIGAQVLKGVLAKVPELDLKEIDDVIMGCAFPEAEQGMNIAKIIAARAGLPAEVPAQTVNRFCSSGLQSIATGANSIIAGQSEVVVAGGVELMSVIPMGGNILYPNPTIMEKEPKEYTTMGITAENVAEKYNITREEQDRFSCESHIKALDARRKGKFAEEIIPVEAVVTKEDEKGYVKMGTTLFDTDEGIREGRSFEGLSRLRTVFKANGTVTAGNSSQTSDGAAVVVLMSKDKVDELGIKPIARFISYSVAGVPAELMGIGPMKAIPKVLEISGYSLENIDLIELNEAFASQSLACIKELGLDSNIVNVNGGAIALGHPLGCTGSFLTVKLIHELKRRNKKNGLVSMCIGGGMGAAGIFEIL